MSKIIPMNDIADNDKELKEKVKQLLIRLA